MDEFCKNILIQETGLEKLIVLFEICGFTSVNEIVDIREKSLNEMENFICYYLSKKEDAHNYLDNLFFYNLSVFKFAPGLRLKILKAIKRIQLENQTRCLIESTKKTLINNDYSSSSELSLSIENTDENIGDFFKVEKTTFSDDNSKSVNIDEKQTILNKTANALINSVARKYPTVKLSYRKHFDLDLQCCPTDGGVRYTGIFYCHLCPRANNQSKIIKFAFKKGNRVIVSNMMTHLKHHFLIGPGDLSHPLSHLQKLLN